MSSRKRRKTKKSNTSGPRTLNLVHWIGRFGNRMFQVAYAKKFEQDQGAEFRCLSKWEGDFIFKNIKTKLIQDQKFREDLLNYGNSPHGQTLGGWQEILKASNKRLGTDFSFIFPYNEDAVEAVEGNKHICMDCSNWDSQYIFKLYTIKWLRDLYEFSDKVKSLDIYKRLEDKQGTYDVAHLRRDDIMYSDVSHNWNYPAISKESYEKAFWMWDADPKRMQWISDDFPSHPNMGWSYPEGQLLMEKEPYYDFLEDFLKIYFARKVFRANSSFSWWACLLNPSGKIYSPILHKRILYSETKEELNCEFIEGNSPHFMHILGYSFGEEHTMQGFHSCPFINIRPE